MNSKAKLSKKKPNNKLGRLTTSFDKGIMCMKMFQYQNRNWLLCLGKLTTRTGRIYSNFSLISLNNKFEFGIFLSKNLS